MEDFNLKMERDIVNLTTDGATVMEKVGRLTDAEHQLCLAHGIHLAVIEVLYKKPTVVTTQSGENGGEAIVEDDLDDDFDDDDTQSFVVENHDTNVQAADLTDDFNLHNLITKIRTVVKLFRRSPTKNDEVLQRYVIGEFGEDLVLILDCKIRWSSLLTMIERFHKLRNCIRKALIDIKSEIVFSTEEMEIIQSVIQILLPVKLAVEALCTQDANLLTANTTLTFLLANIGSGTVLHEKMKSALKKRISQRLTDMSNLLQYLHNGTYVDSSLGLRKLSRDTLVKLIIRLVKKPEDETEAPLSEPLENEDKPQVVYGPDTLKQQLRKAIGKSLCSVLN